MFKTAKKRSSDIPLGYTDYAGYTVVAIKTDTGHVFLTVTRLDAKAHARAKELGYVAYDAGNGWERF